MQKKKMAENKLLKEMFSDQVVVRATEKVIKRSGNIQTTFDTQWSFLDKDRNLLGDSLKLGASKACFAYFKDSFKQVEKNHPGKARYFNYKPANTRVLSKDAVVRWYELGLDTGVIHPTGQRAEEIYKEGAIFDLDAPYLTIGHFYASLCFIRHVREAQNLVRNVTLLVDEAYRDFWAAYTFCHAINVTGTGHSIMPFGGAYHQPGYSNKTSRDLAMPLRMHEFCANPKTVDDRILGATLRSGNNWGWNWHSNIKPRKNHILLDRLMLLSDELNPVWNSTTKKQAQREISKLKLSKESRVKFE